MFYAVGSTPGALSGFAAPLDPSTGDPNLVVADLYVTENGTLAAANGRPTSTLWGRVTIDYLACGRMRFSWDAVDDQSVPAGSTEMVQLTGTNDTCAVDPAKPTMNAIIVQPVFED